MSYTMSKVKNNRQTGKEHLQTMLYRYPIYNIAYKSVRKDQWLNTVHSPLCRRIYKWLLNMYSHA
jgi:hypothetical protein